MPPKPSSAANADAVHDPSGIVEVGELVAEFGLFGIAWLNEDLVVEKCYGRLVDFINVGQPLTDSVLPIVGLESSILELAQAPDQLFELPAVGFGSQTGKPAKLNFTFFWHKRRNQPIVIAYKSPSQSELEIELSKQIRARLMAEAELKEFSKALACANADLEAFATIISHDLKAPLRHMLHLTDDLTALSDDPSLTAKLSAIKSQAARMSGMLSTLLDYSSLGRKHVAIESVNCLGLIQAIVQSMDQSRVTVEISGHWPTIETLKVPLDIVLRNLIANALQHHNKAGGRVTVSCQEIASGLTITVADDGPGIDAKHHETIFLPFRTVLPECQAGSTGMGLAMVKKAIEGVGGLITVQSAPELQRGTTFTVFWPKTPFS